MIPSAWSSSAGAPCWRDLRAGELRLLIVAVTLAVAALTAVGFFADRLKGGLRAMRASCWAAMPWWQRRPDAGRVSSPAPGAGPAKHFHRHGFRRWAARPMRDGGASKLVALKAVPEGYPCAAACKVAASPERPAPTRARCPPAAKPGPIPRCSIRWPQARRPCCWATRSCAHAHHRQEPDRGAGFLNFAPRVMVNEADLPATNLVQPASRTGYRFAVAGNDAT
jgi:putative ABC transport system permease protein